MGRRVLLIASAMLTTGFVPASASDAGQDPHAMLACAECHWGGLADRGIAGVPRDACVRSGCHATDIPERVEIATVQFRHRSHGSTGEISAGCAGCHTHSGGGDPLRAEVGTCALCHRKELSGARGEDCRLCHAHPNHAGTTSQGVPVPHEGLPWIAGGCVRCHYDVSEPVRDVPVSRCAACHADVRRVTSEGIAADLHPTHAGHTCSDCHEADAHRIRAMSSAVNLECSQCHREVHSVASSPEWPGTDLCNSCHGTVHQDPQRLLLGLLPGDPHATPSEKFMAGLTCRSCHVPNPGDDPSRPVRARPEACTSCHRNEYATVARWWEEGARERIRMVGAYLGAARSALSGKRAAASLEPAAERLDLVRKGGAAHNLTLAHRLLQDALARTSEAYRSAGLTPPPPPRIGDTPRMGLCSYCHYPTPFQGYAMTSRMNDAFHREVMSRR